MKINKFKLKISRKILIIAFIFVGALLAFYYFELRQRPIIRDTLSGASEEYLKRQRTSTQSALTNVNLSGPVGDDTRGKRIGRKDCYSFIMPYRVAVTKIEDSPGSSCYARFTFENPKGAIVAYKTEKQVTSWDDIPAVIQRRRDTDEYFPAQEKTLNGKKFLMFKYKSDVYEKNVFYFTDNYFFVFNFLTKSNLNLDRDLDKLISSLELE